MKVYLCFVILQQSWWQGMVTEATMKNDDEVWDAKCRIKMIDDGCGAFMEPRGVC